jgi:hypothetical protein
MMGEVFPHNPTNSSSVSRKECCEAAKGKYFKLICLSFRSNRVTERKDKKKQIVLDSWRNWIEEGRAKVEF